MVTESYGFVIKNKNRRVLFEQVQHNGDCSVNGRFTAIFKTSPAVLSIMCLVSLEMPLILCRSLTS
nr:MAG TPA: hypothetical protein [Inoviridae sp.]